MAENTTPAPSQPAPQAQPSDANKSANVSVSQLAQRFAAEPVAQPAENTPAVAPAAVETAPPPQESVSTETVEALVPEIGEALTEPEPVAEPEADEALSHKTSFTPEQQAIFDKRLGKEVAKRKALEAELAKAKEGAQPVVQPPNLPPVVVSPTPDQPLANITDIGQLTKIADETRQIKFLAEEALDTEGVDQNGAQIGDKVYTKAQLQAIRRNATRQLEMDVPKRAQFLQTRAQYDAAAFQKFPYLADRSSPESQQAIAILRDPNNAYLHYVPNALEQVALIIEGGKAVAARNKAAVKPKAAVAKAPASQVALGGATGSTRQASGTLNENAVANEMKKLSGKRNVTAQDAGRYLKALDQLSSTRS
jgi:hypothetical protein